LSSVVSGRAAFRRPGRVASARIRQVTADNVLESRWTIDPGQVSDGCRSKGSERLAPGADSPSRFGRFHVVSELSRCCAAVLGEPAFSNELRRAGKPDAPPHGDNGG